MLRRPSGLAHVHRKATVLSIDNTLASQRQSGSLSVLVVEPVQPFGRSRHEQKVPSSTEVPCNTTSLHNGSNHSNSSSGVPIVTSVVGRACPSQTKCKQVAASVAFNQPEDRQSPQAIVRQIQHTLSIIPVRFIRQALALAIGCKQAHLRKSLVVALLHTRIVMRSKYYSRHRPFNEL